MGQSCRKKYIFSDEQITAFVDFYNLLKRIHNRLISEGYIIKDGKISKPQSSIMILKSPAKCDKVKSNEIQSRK
jgi:hypothetical protein